MSQYVLNPELVAAIEDRIGPVRVINAGQPLEGCYEPDFRVASPAPPGPPGSTPRGPMRLRIFRRGETYLTSCFCCNDRRGRLAINHMYGVRDGMTGFRGTELWKCYNEECQTDPKHRAAMRDRLVDPMLMGPIRCRRPQIRETRGGSLAACEFPGLLVPLAELPADHPACVYLRTRTAGTFDPVELSREWEVGYAESVPARSRGAMAQDRIILPVRHDGVLVGWQARYVGELDWKAAGVPKYLTYFPKSLTLYGLDRAAGHDPVVLVEGATDVWRYGPGAVSALGKSLSHEQARLLGRLLAGGRTLVVVPDTNDPTAESAAVDSVLELRRQGFTGPVGLAPLPAGTDPARMARDGLRAVVAAAAEAARLSDASLTARIAAPVAATPRPDGEPP